MPKGSKQCPKCKHQCGVRSFNCPNCGAGFTVQGITYPNMGPEQESDEDAQFMRHITTISGDHILHCGDELEVYASLCGKYQIQYYTHRFGIDLQETKNYRLMCTRDGLLEPVKSYRSLRGAVTAMVQHRKENNENH